MSAFGFVLRHGWSFDARALSALSASLQALTPHRIVEDCGYWSAESAFAQPAPQIRWIAIGHSYGFAGLLGDRPTRWHAAVGIGAFLRFPPAGIAQLYRAVERDPHRAVAAFQRRCALADAMPLPPGDIAGTARLLHDLRALEMLDAAPPALPYLLLHGARDAVVPVPAGALVHPVAGHNLGIDEIAWCTDRIAEFVRSLVS